MSARSERLTPPQAPHYQPKLKSTLGLIGDPKRVAREMEDFQREARSYDPAPDKIFYLGRQTLVRKAA